MHNVTLRRVYAAIVAVENKCVLHDLRAFHVYRTMQHCNN